MRLFSSVPPSALLLRLSFRCWPTAIVPFVRSLFLAAPRLLLVSVRAGALLFSFFFRCCPPVLWAGAFCAAIRFGFSFLGCPWVWGGWGARFSIGKLPETFGRCFLPKLAATIAHLQGMGFLASARVGGRG
ncbi:uncharacterized protein TM35_000092040 [Trypanosoma theileri]|uniref:Uncharacterized protein n=1 Tax=Trypanosoma theileri TaxID=67003 RepID=A0A1X0NZM9_9TRYP|nr:uncharacterized protein TM35_000092040 [Trypanosoma theileri]ORC90154.1 hypothetical protein TM35_000092040 [Trypanosoma theileri]